MPLPITIPNTFASATSSIPLANLDNNFTVVSTAINSMGNGAYSLANVSITGGNLTVTNGNITTFTGTTATLSGNLSAGNASVSGVVTVTGTLTAGNVTTAGATSTGTAAVTGNLTAGNVSVSGVATVTGNISGGNLASAAAITTVTLTASGNISAGNAAVTANVSAGNVSVSGITTVTGNLTAGNVTTAGLATAGNFTTAGNVAATGNVTAGNATVTTLATVGTLNATTIKVGGNQATNGPAFNAYANGAQSILNNSVTKVQFGTADFNVGSCYDAVTNYRFTPNVAGYYSVSALAAFTTTPALTSILFYIYKNGSPVRLAVGSVVASGNDPGASISGLIQMNGSTDYLEIYILQTNSGAASISLLPASGGDQPTCFSAFMARGL